MADGLTDEQVSTTLDYLGGGQPGVAPRLSTLPSSSAGGGSVNAPVTGGVGGSPGSPAQAMGQNMAAPGASPFAIIGQGLKLGKSLSQLASEVFKADPTARGSVGGEGTNQDASKSLSDQLRSGQPPNGPTNPAPGESITGMNEPADIPPVFTPPTPIPGNSITTMNEPADLPPVDSGASGFASGLGTAGTAGGAVSAALALAAMLSGNPDVSKAAGGVGALTGIISDVGAVTGAAAGAIGEAGIGAGVGGAIAAGSEAAGAGLAGLASAVAGPLAVVTAPLLFASIAHLAGADPGSLDISDMFGGGFDTIGSSKRTTQRRIAGGQAAFNDVQQIDAATAAVDQARTQNVTDPTQLRALGDELMAARSTVFSGDPRFNEGQASVDAKVANLDQQWMAINNYLTSTGQPALQINPNYARYQNLGIGDNLSQYQNTDKGDLSFTDTTPAKLPADIMGFLGLDPNGSYTVGQINTFINHPDIQNKLDPYSPAMQALYQEQLAGKLKTDLTWGGQSGPSSSGPPAPSAAPAAPAASALDFARNFSTTPLDAVPTGPEGALGFAQEALAA